MSLALNNQSKLCSAQYEMHTNMITNKQTIHTNFHCCEITIMVMNNFLISFKYILYYPM